MRPGMVADFVAFAHGAFQNFRMVRGILSDNEKGRLHVMRSQQIEQLRGEGGIRTIIESHGHVRSFDVDRVVGDLRDDRRRRRGGLRRDKMARKSEQSAEKNRPNEGHESNCRGVGQAKMPNE